jgi:hypothetical protein
MGFQKGQSGNPAGRPKGCDTRQSRLREQISKAIPDVIEGVIVAAKDGDMVAARLLMDRVLPALKAVDTPAPLPPGVDLANAEAGPAGLLRALSDGALTPDQTSTIASALLAVARVREVSELEARITRLEESANGPKP